MNYQHLLLAAACVGLSVTGTTARAQSAHTPAPGTSERSAVLDALRPSIEAELGPSIEFVVEEIRVMDGWAIVNANPQRKGGGKIDCDRYYGADCQLGGIGVTGILRYSNRRWNLVERSIGATDVWWCNRVPYGLSDVCDRKRDRLK